MKLVFVWLQSQFVIWNTQKIKHGLLNLCSFKMHATEYGVYRCYFLRTSTECVIRLLWKTNEKNALASFVVPFSHPDNAKPTHHFFFFLKTKEHNNIANSIRWIDYPFLQLKTAEPTVCLKTQTPHTAKIRHQLID